MIRLLLLIVLLALGIGAFFLLRPSPEPSAEERNRKFAESMNGVTLTGSSTRLNREGVFGPEKYRIDSVTHLTGDTWLFRARLEHRGKEIPVPIPLTLKWAGDTPVITMTDLTIPGVGTYTARIVLYRDQYAGMWAAQNAGGQMFGRIVR